jgi:DNA-binding XRE family transcriptional regulator
MKSPCARFLPRKEIRQMQGDSASPLAIFVHIATGCDFQFEKRKHKPSLRICSGYIPLLPESSPRNRDEFCNTRQTAIPQGRSYAI